ncbi:odorant receptor 49b-like [Xylocopa sonorina]|uniref:odorant receptor 49b-like n=1 Tax=Xylocopa sonorina TaxID=1818115 RepID=UPI00403AF461
MAMFNANIREILYVLELAGSFTCTWPPDPNGTKREAILRDVRWLFTMFNVISLLICLALAIFHFQDDIVVVMKTATEINTLLEVFLDLLFCKLKSAQLQILIAKVKAFLEVANEMENEAMQGYVDRYQSFFSVTAMGYIACGISFTFVPLISDQELPVDAWIPFSMEPFAIYAMVYASHVYCILQTAFCIGVDFTIVVLFAFPAVKLDILGTKLRDANDNDRLISCVKEHQEIIRFVEDTKATVEALLFKTNITMGSAVIFGAFPLLYNQSTAIVSQFLPLVVSGCAHLYVISWPADDLKESSLRFAQSINDIPWIGKRREMTKTVVIMMQRSQKAFLVTMGTLLPALTLEYFANFLTTVSSYFMAMRTMIES